MICVRTINFTWLELQIWKDMSTQDKLRYQQEIAEYQEPMAVCDSAWLM